VAGGREREGRKEIGMQRNVDESKHVRYDDIEFGDDNR